MSRAFGFDLLAEQAADIVAADVAGLEAYWPFGETPIEKLFSAALMTYVRVIPHNLAKGDLRYILPRFADVIDTALKEEATPGRMILQIQPQLDGWRPDFILHVYADWARFETYRPHGWRKLIIECDGHDFHERTKEQAAKDRARDREAQSIGYEIFRFTGSELWRDPLGCAKQVIDWAEKGI